MVTSKQVIAALGFATLQSFALQRRQFTMN
jgi:hypothetical protein